MPTNLQDQTIIVSGLEPEADGSVNTGSVGSSLATLAARFHPDKGDTWINWDYPRYAHTGIDVDYKLTGYDWGNNTISWSVVSATSTVNPLTINSVSGLVSWTPDASESLADIVVTVRMTAGAQTVDKTFTITVDNSRFVFVDWAVGLDSASRGTEASPYKSVRYALTQEAVDNTGQVYLVRGGTSNESYTYTASDATDHPLGTSTYSATQPILVRNYPSETVTNDCLGAGGSYVTGCAYSVVYGLNATNMTGGVGMCAVANAVVKNCTVRGLDDVFGINPTGIRYTAGAVVDSCISGDNYDRAGGQNSQDYMGYMDIGSGDAYLIDCISEGPVAATYATCAFRSKHPSDWDAATYQGAYQTFFHRCVVENQYSGGYAAIVLNAGDSFRHGVGMFDGFNVRSEPTQAEIGRPSTLSQSLISISQGNLWIGTGSRSGSSMANWTDRFFIYDDEYVAHAAFNPFVISLVDTAAGNEGFDFQNNTFYAATDSAIDATVSSVNYSFADFNVVSTGDNDRVGGQNNQRISLPATLSKVAAGKTWTWNGTTLTGVNV